MEIFKTHKRIPLYEKTLIEERGILEVNITGKGVLFVDINSTVYKYLLGDMDHTGYCRQVFEINQADYLTVKFEGSYSDLSAVFIPETIKPENNNKTIYQKLEEIENTIKEIKEQLKAII